MENNHSVKRFLLIAILISCATAAKASVQGSAPLCVWEDDSLHVDSKIARVIEHRVITSLDSLGVLHIENRGRRAIVQTRIIVSYKDSSDKTLFNLVYRSERDGNYSPLSRGFAIQGSVQKLGAPVRPKTSVLLVSFGGVTVARCPQRAEITLLELTYEDGSTHFSTTAGWTRDAEFRRSKQQFQIQPALLAEQRQFLLGAEISDTGRIVSVAEVQDSAPRLLEEVRAQLQHWEFWPASVEGKPVASVVKLLFRFFPEGRRGYREAYRIQRKDVPYPLVVVNLHLEDPSRGIWSVEIGDRSTSGYYTER